MASQLQSARLISLLGYISIIPDKCEAVVSDFCTADLSNDANVATEWDKYVSSQRMPELRMPLEYFSNESIQWCDLPMWRKLVLLACGVGIFILGTSGYQEIEIYSNSPQSPISNRGQIYPLRVMHGSLRYVTFDELESFRTSQDHATLIGIPFVIGFLVLVTSGKRKSGSQGHSPSGPVDSTSDHIS